MGNVSEYLSSKGTKNVSNRVLNGTFKSKKSKHECSVKIKPKYLKYLICNYLRQFKLISLCPNELVDIIIKYSLDKSCLIYNKNT